jgi:uncharacterized membrane protein
VFGGVAALYLTSVAIVSAFAPGETLVGAFEIAVRQDAQLALSGFWSVCGFGLLLLGLRRGLPLLRAAGFGLLLLVFGKVFLFDLATLGSVYRVASFVGLGLLLLLAALAYQRLRPAIERKLV